MTVSFTLTSIFFLSFPPIESLNQKEEEIASSDYDLLIISSDIFQHLSIELANHKKDFNTKTIIKNTGDLYGKFDGKDKQEQIKYCIKQAYDTHHISSVLLIGDFNDIPVRYCHNNDEFQSLEPYFISDLYYADLYDDNGCFSSWNADGDSLFGEWNGQFAEDNDISLTPEVSIGRLPCSNRFELKTMIDKIIRYETSLDTDEWFHRIVVAGGDTYSEARGYNGTVFQLYEGEEQAIKIIGVMSDFQSTPLFASKGTLSTFSLLNAISKGCGFLYLSGHGSPGLWCTHPPNSAEKVGNFPNYLIPLLRNRIKLPICLVGACQNSKFDVHLGKLFQDPFLYGTWHPECWSWKLTSSPFGGSIASLGYTGLSWQGIEFGGGGADWLELQFFKEYANGTTNLGNIWKKVITKYLQEFPIDWETESGGTSSLNAKTVQEWALIGDPTLQIKV